MDIKSLLYLQDRIGQDRTEAIREYLKEQRCGFKITAPRLTKRGDFRVKGDKLLITLNRDDNRYRFILTLAHELAHLKTYRDHGNKVRPHGVEWKIDHQTLFYLFKLDEFFEEEPQLHELMIREMKNPRACSGVDLELERMLGRFDGESVVTYLEDIKAGSEFEFRNQQYRKIEDRRSRVLCMNIANKRKYTINKAARVKPLDLGEE